MHAWKPVRNARCIAFPCWVDGGVCPDFHAATRMPILSVFAAVEGGGGGTGGGAWKEHGSTFPACRGQPVFQTTRARPPSPPRHVTSPLSARSARLRSPNCSSDTLAIFRRWSYTWCLRGLGAFLRLKEIPSRMLVFVSAALTVPSRNGSSASKLSAQLITCLLRE